MLDAVDRSLLDYELDEEHNLTSYLVITPGVYTFSKSLQSVNAFNMF